MRRIKRFLELCCNFLFTNKTKLLTMKILCLSAYYSFCIKLIHLSKLEKNWGIPFSESKQEETVENLKYATLIGLRVKRTCEKTPWSSECLVQALTARRLLLKKDIPSTLYLGITKEDSKMAAHAWLRVGRLYVVGGSGKQHTIVSKFAN